jgi:hypothetical protein
VSEMARFWVRWCEMLGFSWVSYLPTSFLHYRSGHTLLRVSTVVLRVVTSREFSTRLIPCFHSQNGGEGCVERADPTLLTVLHDVQR